jgi:hypothetical protein
MPSLGRCALHALTGILLARHIPWHEYLRRAIPGGRPRQRHRADDRSKLARVGAGWHLCLDVLEANLDGRQLPWEPDERWSRLYSTIYERAFD